LTLKEIRLRPETDQHDLDTKLRHAREFLQKGHKVQFSIFFRGRQMLHKEKGYEILRHITDLLQEISKIDQPARMTGKRMRILLTPKQQPSSG